MYPVIRWLAVIVLFVARLFAQPPATLAGHWQGQAQVAGAAPFELDIMRTTTGAYTGTVTIPKEGLSGLPLTVAVEGERVSFFARTDQKFEGTLSPDGAEVSGKYQVGSFSFPFKMTRTGDARFETSAPSPAISRQLEGTWNGTLKSANSALRLVLTLSNRPDGTSVGKIRNLDEGGLEIPVAAIAQRAPEVLLDLKAVNGSYAGTLNADGTELTGTYKQGTASVPLTFHRATE